MSIRKNKNLSVWKAEAVSISNRLTTFFTPLLQETLESDMTSEDFYYLVADAALMVVLKNNIDRRLMEEKEEKEK